MVNVKEANRKCIDQGMQLLNAHSKAKIIFSTPTSLIENYTYKYGGNQTLPILYVILKTKAKSLVIDIGANVGATTIPQTLKFSTS